MGPILAALSSTTARTVGRYLHTSAVTPRGLLLVGGVEYSNTTELQVSTSSVIIIGGSGAGSLVTEYSALDQDEP